MNDKPLTFRFKFRAPAERIQRPPTMLIDLGPADSKGLDMMKAGKMPLPSDLKDLTKGELKDMGVAHVRYSKAFGKKYVDLVPKKKGQYDS